MRSALPRPGSRTWVLIALMTTAAVDVAADAERDLQVAFHRANEHYQHERFVEAVEGYHAILERGVESGPLYYNLGNALLKQGRKGEALWAYLKADRLIPRDQDLRANLDYVRSLLAQGVRASLAPSWAVRWLTFHQRLATDELAGWTVVLLWLSAAGWIAWSWLPSVRAAVQPIAAIVSLTGGFCLLALVTQTVWVDSAPHAVTVSGQVEVKFAPQEDGTTHYTLPEGTLVRVLDHDRNWVQIQRADGRAGWVPAETVNRR